MEDLRIEEAVGMSVWGVTGTPMIDGELGPRRSGLFVLSLTATSADAVGAFLAQASLEDKKRYVGGRIESTNYFGWAWIPQRKV